MPLSILAVLQWRCQLSSFFFFQAEDGIRDYKVTGVQTCALPIYHLARHSAVAFGFELFLAHHRFRLPLRHPCRPGARGRGISDQFPAVFCIVYAGQRGLRATAAAISGLCAGYAQLLWPDTGPAAAVPVLFQPRGDFLMRRAFPFQLVGQAFLPVRFASALPRIFPALLFLSFSAPAGAGHSGIPGPAAPQQVVDRIVARVQDDILMLSELRELGRYQQLVQDQAASDDRLLTQLLEQWIVNAEATAAR